MLPNVPEAIIGLLASASIGATWCICSPDLAVRATLDRLGQLDPVVLIGSRGYTFSGKWFDRTAHFAEVRAGLPTVKHTIVVEGDGNERDDGSLRFAELSAATAMPAFERVAFDHPLWVLFTSGTGAANFTRHRDGRVRSGLCGSA